MPHTFVTRYYWWAERILGKLCRPSPWSWDQCLPLFKAAAWEGRGWRRDWRGVEAGGELWLLKLSSCHPPLVVVTCEHPEEEEEEWKIVFLLWSSSMALNAKISQRETLYFLGQQFLAAENKCHWSWRTEKFLYRCWIFVNTECMLHMYKWKQSLGNHLFLPYHI